MSDLSAFWTRTQGVIGGDSGPAVGGVERGALVMQSIRGTTTSAITKRWQTAPGGCLLGPRAASSQQEKEGATANHRTSAKAEIPCYCGAASVGASIHQPSAKR